MIIAVDGPSASGKGTLSRKIAEHFGFSHLDTGLLYRAVAFTLKESGADLEDEAAAVIISKTLDLASLEHPKLRSQEVSEMASIVAAMGDVRAALLEAQRHFAQKQGGAVLDGRDIGTVVFPDAAVKLFVTASPEVRARRRTLEAKQAGKKISFEEVLRETLQRDMRDATRAVAPLRMAEDAILLDTSNWDITRTVQEALRAIHARVPSAVRRSSGSF